MLIPRKPKTLCIIFSDKFDSYYIRQKNIKSIITVPEKVTEEYYVTVKIELNKPFEREGQQIKTITTDVPKSVYKLLTQFPPKKSKPRKILEFVWELFSLK